MKLTSATYQKNGFGDNARGNLAISNNSSTQSSYMRAEAEGKVTITAKDAAGHTTSKVLNMKQDRTRPKLNITAKIGKYDSKNNKCTAKSSNYDFGDWSNAGCILYTVKGSDNVKLSSATYKKSGYGNNASGNLSIKNNSVDWSNWMRATGEGKLTIKLKDAYGHTTDKTVTMRLDRSAPTCSSSKSGSASGVTASFSCSDDLSKGVSCTSRKTGLKTGTHSYSIKDKAGNTGTCSVKVYSKPQYKKKSCTQYKLKQHSSCGYNEAGVYQLCTSEGLNCSTSICNKCNGKCESIGNNGANNGRHAMICTPYAKCRKESFGCNKWGSASWSDSGCGNKSSNSCKVTDTRTWYY